MFFGFAVVAAVAASTTAAVAASSTSTAAGASTFANPLDLDYRFQLSPPSRREAADPTVVIFNGAYYLFASKSGGYWHSPDLASWELIEPTGLPLEVRVVGLNAARHQLSLTMGASHLCQAYAPTAMAHDGFLYFTAGGAH